MPDPTPAEIARRYTRRAFSVLRVAAGLGADAERAVGRLSTEIERLIVGAAVDELGRRDLAALLRDIDQRIAERFAIIAAEQVAAMREILAIEAAWASGVIGQGETAAAMLARMERDLLVLGARPGDQWTRQGEALSQRIADAVREGATLGTDGLRESIGDIASIARRDAQQLADVSTTSAAGQAHAEVARAEGAVAFRWLSLLDSRTTTGCAIRHGLMYTLDYQPIGHTIPIERPPPRHWGCLLGDTHVSACGRITGMFERIYDGEIIVLRTASGNQVSVTPNHPILTDRGWVAAGLLDVGCNVISSGLGEWVANGSDADSEHVPARIKDMADALRRSGDMGSVPVPLAAEDFHGDGGGSNVAVVWSDGDLGNRIYAALAEHAGEDDLSLGHAPGHPGLTGDGGALQSLRGVGSPALCGVGCGCVLLPLLRGEAESADDVGFSAGSHLDSALAQDAKDRHDGDAESGGEVGGTVAGSVASADFSLMERDAPASTGAGIFDSSEDDRLGDASLARNLIDGHFGPVFLDAIVDKSVIVSSAHVYNLETDSGAFVSNGIITHNCRSILAPWLRMPKPGDRDGEGTFDTWLATLSQAEQDDVLGKGRADLYRRKVITKADLVNQRGRVLTLAELRGRVD